MLQKVLQAVEITYASKTKVKLSLPRNLIHVTFVFFSKDKSALPSIFNGLEVLSSASDETNLFTENFSKIPNLCNLRSALPTFHSGTNLELHSICVTPKLVNL